MKRKFYDGEIYHIVNKSIANFRIFGDDFLKQRFIELLEYYNHIVVRYRYSVALQLNTYQYNNCLIPEQDNIIKILSYCIMPDHYHLLLKIVNQYHFSHFISNIENSYSRFFNLINHRKGPLWQSRFREKKIKTNEQLLHVGRYIHLNPTTNYLVDNPSDWKFSSYCDLITYENIYSQMTEFSIIKRETFKNFTENQIDYQRKLKEIKRLILE